MIVLNRLFADGAVFQRRVLIPIWGKASPYVFVEAEFDGASARTVSGIDGSFFLRLPAHEAGGPYTLTVRDHGSGEILEIRDILVGEVWLASGQSNMELLLSQTTQKDAFIQANRNPGTLRVFNVPKNAKSVRANQPDGEWSRTAADKAPDFSAVAQWFGLSLRDELDVPVGIISSSWGGTIAETWTSRNTLLRNPDFTAALENYAAVLNDPETWKDKKSARQESSTSNQNLYLRNCKPDVGNIGLELGWAKPDFNDSDWYKSFTIPGNWMEPVWRTSASAPLQPLCGNGVVWIRQRIVLPDEMTGKKLVLHMGPVDKQDITYFNGVEIGRRGKDFEDKWYNVPREYDIPAGLVRQGENLLAVRAFSFIYDGCFNGTKDAYYIEEPVSGMKIPFAGLCRFKVEQDHGIGMVVFQPAKWEPDNPNSPNALFDTMIRPLIPYAIRGVIWYQGESNAHSIEQSRQYERLMSDLIKDWRFWWEQGDFPFIMVHLAAYMTPKVYDEKSTWGVLRESQRRTKNALPNVGLVSAIDCGDSLNIHPNDKRTVGERLFAWAMANVYGSSKAGEGPSMRRCIREGNRIRVVFDHCDQGLITKDGKAPCGFFIAGSDRKWYPADAVIKENTVELVSRDVPIPQFVRFAWAHYPQDFNLYNGAGFPAEPFED